tara:strand:- start:1220 stop:1510 length:291 start_codon:yes stop_codon:yes gene_type:complete
MTNKEISKRSKRLIMAMTFEFAILIIKLTIRLQRVGKLEDDEMDDIANSVCKLQSLIGKTLDVNQSDIDEGASIAFRNNDIDKSDLNLFNNLVAES